MLLAVEVIVAIPELPEATEIGLANVPLNAPFKVALALPLESPIVIVLAAPPNDPATLPLTVPALMSRPPVKRLVPVVRVNCEVELFWMTVVTSAPMTALISVSPAPAPELVIVPVLLTLVVEIVMPLVIELLLFRTKLPAPVIPPDMVSTLVPLGLLFVRVVPEPFIVMALVLIVSADAALFSMIAVTFEPTPPDMIFVAEPAPELVIVPVLLTLVVERVITPAAVEFNTRLPAPVMPPVKVRALAAGDRIRS